MKSKKFIAGVMAVALVFGSAAVLPNVKTENGVIISASAEDEDISGDSSEDEREEIISGDWCYYDKTDDDASPADGSSVKPHIGILRYLGSDTNIIIPNEIDGKEVTSLEQGAFKNNKEIDSVILPDSIDFIPSELFSGCSNLSEISFPNKYLWFSFDAFEGTAWLDNKRSENPLVTVNGFLIDGKTCKGDITIPEDVTTIGIRAFGGNTDITSVTIPSSVEYVDFQAIGFDEYWSQIPGIKIYCYPETAGEQYAIDNGFDYELLDVPDDSSVEESSVTTPDSSWSIPVDDSASSATDTTEFKHSEVTDGIEITDNTVTGDAVKIPENIDGKNVVSVGDWAFAGMEIKSVELPSVLKNIGEYAFFNCPVLTSVTIPKSVENIGDYAFGYYLDEDAVSGSSAVTLAGAMAVDVNKVKKVDGFKIYCYTGTAGEKYAVDNGFDYVLLDKSDFDTTTSSKSEATSNSTNANTNSTANPSTGAAAGLALAALGLGAVVVTKRRK